MTPPKCTEHTTAAPKPQPPSPSTMIAPQSAVAPPSAGRRLLAWTVSLSGIAVFVVGWIGAQTGVIAMPGDRHHVVSQFAGFALFFVGVRIGSRWRRA